jgi:hypothetical protein
MVPSATVKIAMSVMRYSASPIPIAYG